MLNKMDRKDKFRLNSNDIVLICSCLSRAFRNSHIIFCPSWVVQKQTSTANRQLIPCDHWVEEALGSLKMEIPLQSFRTSLSIPGDDSFVKSVRNQGQLFYVTHKQDFLHTYQAYHQLTLGCHTWFHMERLELQSQKLQPRR